MFATNYQVDFANRKNVSEVDPLLIERWSPRSFQPIELPREIQTKIFTAAGYAPSAFNEQPWLIKTAGRESKNFAKYLDLLVEQNQVWAKNASLIGFIFKQKHFSYNDKFNRWASHDCGAAWMNMTYQARLLGLYTHAMAGIKSKQLCSALDVSDEKYKPLTGFVIGIIDQPDKLPDELAKEEKPNQRKALHEIWIAE
ncbi:MAG: nitroreductase family protein [Candidatus Cloacimonadales bacterium]